MDEDQTVREAMRIIGSRTSEKKAAAAKENAQKLRSPEVRAKLRAAQAERRRREAEEKGIAWPPAAAPVRPRGRPKKAATGVVDAHLPTEGAKSPENG